MKFKSLLLGSAATMAVASMAQAADAIVVEPEPVEYVRVCDMYGTGYFYIPGTETCLKLGGYVQAEYASSHYHDQPQNIFVNSDREVVFQDTDTLGNHFFRSRALLNVTAKNETAYGTLHSEIRWYSQVLDGNPDFDTFSTVDSRRDDGVGVWLATMSLAGFRVGYDATNYTIWNTYGGYGFYNAAQSGGYTEASGFLFEYNGSIGNLDYGIGIVDTAQSGAAGQPDIMAGLLTNFGDLALGGAVVYDSNSQGFAYRVRADYDLSSFIPGFRFGGWWSADNGETDYRKGHQWGVTARMRVLDNVTVFAGYSEYDYSCDLDNDDSPGDPANHGGAWGNAYPNAVTGGQCSAYAGGFSGRYEADYGSDQWTAGARWDVTPNLYVQLEYNKLQETTFTPVTPRRRENSVITETDRGTTWLRIRRSF